MEYNDLGLGNSSGSSKQNPQVEASSNRIATVCKATAVISFILSFISGIILGNTMKVRSYDDFNFSVAFYVWAGCFLFCLILFAIGEIIKQLSISNDNANKMEQQNERIIQVLTNGNQVVKSSVNSNSFENSPNI